ncbi:unnamed protein product [Paramecium sonneborni]|uniref:LITAF domain-containing protein n=1 Tax=Paramecium sonneborni TaxID=65129 RepID=A0A8S1MCV5_9CILI|nr:unnamed protein product [Paramecium sonneborni]
MQYNQANNQQGQYPNNYISQQYPEQYPQYPQQYPAQSQQFPQYPNQPNQPYMDNNIPNGQPVNQGYQTSQQYQQVQQPYITNVAILVPTPIQISAEGMRFPVQIKCQFCQQVGITIVENRIGNGTICASILVLLLCWPLFWLPCCLEDCKDKIHLCQNCGKIVGQKEYELC